MNSVKVVGRMLCWLTHRRENLERLLSRGKTVLMHREFTYVFIVCRIARGRLRTMQLGCILQAALASIDESKICLEDTL